MAVGYSLSPTRARKKMGSKGMKHSARSMDVGKAKSVKVGTSHARKTKDMK